jgi:hypothetical protein
MNHGIPLGALHSNLRRRVLLQGYGWCGAAIGAVMSFGCTAGSGSDEMSDATLGNVQEPSAIAAFTPWSMPINVCYSRATSTDQGRDANGAFLFNGKRLTTTEYAAAKVEATATLLATWPKVPGLGFTGLNDCGTIGANTLVMKLTPGGGGTCGGGQNAVCEMRAVITRADGMPNVGWERGFRPGLVHEVGHALGLAHEHKRLDAVPASCESARVVACLSCRQDVESARACKAADYNACFDDISSVFPATPVQFDQTFGIGSAQYNELQGVIGNNETDNALERLTVYDPRSIMNYCSESNGRVGDDYMPTSLDLLGVEMVYPRVIGNPIGCRQGCYHTSSGGVIARPDGLLQTDWAERGARNSGVLVHGAPQATEFFAAFGNTSTISYNFWAPVIPGQNPPPAPRVLTASGTFVNSNSAHTAVTIALTGTML